MLARDAAEVAEATREHAVPPLNMLFADRDGNIGYQLAGRVPIRRGDCPDVPKPGWTGEFEWDGVIPYDELPLVLTIREGRPAHEVLRIRAADGDEHEIEVSALPILTPHGSRGGIAFFWPTGDSVTRKG